MCCTAYYMEDFVFVCLLKSNMLLLHLVDVFPEINVLESSKVVHL